MGRETNSKTQATAELSLRSSLLNWYPFPDGQRALLVGRDATALAPLLQQHFALVDQLTHDDLVRLGATPAHEDAYDCIAAVDLVEEVDDVPALLSTLYEALSEDGVLLLAYRNRFGLKYLCGGIDEYAGAPFAVLQPNGTGHRLYARREMELMLTSAGFAQPQCYFLMPDANMVQAVYTESLLPTDSIRDRVLPLDLHDSPLVAWEGDLYDDMVREGTLPYVANVYLAECRKPGAPAPDKRVIYAALSTDRGEEHGFATVLYSDGTARKLPLHPKGLTSLRQLCENMEALEARGIPTVRHTMTDAGVEMPLVREEGLLAYLRRQLSEDPEAFLAVFEQIWHDVLRSSPVIEKPDEDLSEIWGADAEKLAPVLDCALIDMIPYNAFWSGGRIRYYDQEFAVRNCPARYILFRALNYTWIHIPEAESVSPLETMKERFGLTELWDGFQLRENRFVAENRNWKEALSRIYDHAHPNRIAIAQHRKALRTEVVPQAVRNVQLELLRELDHVCRANGLRYMAIHGTLLGAVRHHGFIPWDDDVDIAMPRKDYDRLLSLADDVLSPGFFLQTPRNNTGCFYGGYSKLRRDGTRAAEPQNEYKAWGCCHQGIWVDILPLDPCPEDDRKRRRMQDRLSLLQRIVYAKTYDLPHFVPKDVSGARVSLYYLLAKCTYRRRLLAAIDRICRGKATSPLVGIMACYYGAYTNENIWPASALESTTEMPFEDTSIPVPTGWDEVLRTRYGNDYMSIPPIERRHRRHNIEFEIGE